MLTTIRYIFYDGVEKIHNILMKFLQALQEFNVHFSRIYPMIGGMYDLNVLMLIYFHLLNIWYHMDFFKYETPKHGRGLWYHMILFKNKLCNELVNNNSIGCRLSGPVC